MSSFLCKLTLRQDPRGLRQLVLGDLKFHMRGTSGNLSNYEQFLTSRKIIHVNWMLFTSL